MRMDSAMPLGGGLRGPEAARGPSIEPAQAESTMLKGR